MITGKNKEEFEKWLNKEFGWYATIADFYKYDARLQQAIMTLDPAKIKQFMSKLGDVASTLPAQQAAKILDHFQRRVLNELDKHCIRKGWMLFDESSNRCV